MNRRSVLIIPLLAGALVGHEREVQLHRPVEQGDDRREEFVQATSFDRPAAEGLEHVQFARSLRQPQFGADQLIGDGSLSPAPLGRRTIRFEVGAEPPPRTTESLPLTTSTLSAYTRSP